jgi:hypothetical protein
MLAGPADVEVGEKVDDIFILKTAQDTDQDTVIDKERRDLENRTNRTRQNTRGVQSSFLMLRHLFLMLRHLFPMSRTPEEGAHTWLLPLTATFPKSMPSSPPTPQT